MLIYVTLLYLDDFVRIASLRYGVSVRYVAVNRIRYEVVPPLFVFGRVARENEGSRGINHRRDLDSRLASAARPNTQVPLSLS